MEIVLYVKTSDKNHLTPVLTNTLTLSDCVIRRDTEIDKPLLEITSSSNLSGYNYCYIARYGRYYDCTIRTVANGIWAVECVSDPLASFATQIRNLSGTITRGEAIYNGYLNDPEYKALAPLEYTFKEFPSGMEDNALILITIG